MINPTLKNQLVVLFDKYNVPEYTRDTIFSDIENKRTVYDGTKMIAMGGNDDAVKELDAILNNPDLYMQVTQEEIKENEPLVVSHQMEDDMVVELKSVPFNNFDTFHDFEAAYNLDHSICLSMISEMKMYHSISPSLMRKIWDNPQIQKDTYGSEKWSDEEKEILQQCFYKDLMNFFQRANENKNLQSKINFESKINVDESSVIDFKEEKNQELEEKNRLEQAKRQQTFEILKDNTEKCIQEFDQLITYVVPSTLTEMSVDYKALVQTLNHVLFTYENKNIELTEDEKQLLNQAREIQELIKPILVCKKSMDDNLSDSLAQLFAIVSKKDVLNLNKQEKQMIEELDQLLHNQLSNLYEPTKQASQNVVLNLGEQSVSDYIEQLVQSALTVPQKMRDLLKEEVKQKVGDEASTQLNILESLNPVEWLSNGYAQDCYKLFEQAQSIKLSPEKEEEESIFILHDETPIPTKEQFFEENYKPIKLNESAINKLLHWRKKKQVENFNESQKEVLDKTYNELYNPQVNTDPKVIEELLQLVKAYSARSEQYIEGSIDERELEDITDVELKEKGNKKIKLPEKAVRILKPLTQNVELRKKKRQVKKLSSNELAKEIQKVVDDAEDLQKQLNRIDSQKCVVGIQIKAILESLPESKQFNAEIKKIEKILDQIADEQIQQSTENLKDMYKQKTLMNINQELGNLQTDLNNIKDERMKVQKLYTDNQKMNFYLLERYIKLATDLNDIPENIKNIILNEAENNLRLKALLNTKYNVTGKHIKQDTGKTEEGNIVKTEEQENNFQHEQEQKNNSQHEQEQENISQHEQEQENISQHEQEQEQENNDTVNVEKEATKDDLLAMKQLVEQLRAQGIDPQIVFDQATNLHNHELSVEEELAENTKKSK